MEDIKIDGTILVGFILQLLIMTRGHETIKLHDLLFL